MDEQQKWKSIAEGVGAVALVAICCAIYGCSQDKKEQPKVMEYRQTTDPGAVKKELVYLIRQPERSPGKSTMYNPLIRLRT